MCNLSGEEIQDTVVNIPESEENIQKGEEKENIQEDEHIYTCSRRHCKRQNTRLWPKGFVFNYRINGVLPGSRQDIMEAAFEKAQKKWAQHITFKFQKATTGAPNLVIHVVGPNDYPFRNNPGAQGYANIGPAGPITAPSNIYFKGPGTSWGPGSIHTLFLHEFGHVLGLNHSNNRGAIMAPSIQGMFSERQLTPVDSKRAQIIASRGNPNTSEYMLFEGQGQQRQRPGPQYNNQRFSPAQRQRPGPQYNQRFNQAQRPQYNQPQNRFNPVRQQRPFTRGRTQN